VKVTLISQPAPAATEPGQVLVWAKSPLAVIVRGVRAPAPVLLSTSFCGGLEGETACPGKLRLVAERLTTGARPTPLRLTVWGLLRALSVSVSTPARSPAAVGVKVTLIVQPAPAATEPPQVLVWAKSPPVPMVRGVRAPFPVLVSVSVCGGLEIDTVCAGKLRLVAERLTPGTTPVPLRLTVWGLPRARSVSESVPV